MQRGLHARDTLIIRRYVIMTDNWLQTYLIECIGKDDLCIEPFCTTCGALEFRRGVLGALEKVTGQRPNGKLDADRARSILLALKNVNPIAGKQSRIDDALYILLTDLRSVIGAGEMIRILGDAETWAGREFHDLRDSEKARNDAARARVEYFSPANVQKRRDEKKRVRQEKHQQRLALKKERDQKWREKQCN